MHIIASVRAGRTREMNDVLSFQLNSHCAMVLDKKADAVTIVLNEVPASWVMEGGRCFTRAR